jgi:DNA-binding transcriptional ArsR family regulator
VRLRLVNALSRGRELTTSELCARLKDVSQATVYRQVGLLVKGGLLEVVAERQARGAIERTYRLHEARARVAPEQGKAMSRADHRRAFGSAMAALIGEFNAYIARRDASPLEDGVGYRQATVWLSPGEHAALVDQVSRVLAGYWANTPGEGRRPHLLSTIIFPAAEGRPARRKGR